MYNCKFKRFYALLAALVMAMLLALPVFAEKAPNRLTDLPKDAVNDAKDKIDDAKDKVEEDIKGDKEDEPNDGNNAEDGITDDGATGDKDGVIGDENAEDHKKPVNDGESGAMDDMNTKSSTAWAIIIGLILAAIVVLLIVLLIPDKQSSGKRH